MSWRDAPRCGSAAESEGGWMIEPDESNIHHCLLTLEGPAGSPYEGGVFYMNVIFPEGASPARAACAAVA